MRRPKSGRAVSPYPQTFSRAKALKREATTISQKNWQEDTIFYGDDDALPLRIAQAVYSSPAARACIDTIAQFIKGSGFTDKSLMNVKINQLGETLWQHHSKLADACPLFFGFAVNLKFNSEGKITNAYDMSFESLRFVKPKQDVSVNIDWIKYNPYFGTDEYQKIYTTTYPLYNPDRLGEHVNELGANFKGQVYYFGKTSPLYRFYPVPSWWSAKYWIEVDGQIQQFHKENLDNGFFQSGIMNVIGDPNAMSRNPKYVVEEVDPVTGNKVQRSTKTVGEEFNDQMSDSFSGSKKAGTVMVLWSHNSDTAVKYQAFPSNLNAEAFQGVLEDATEEITLATGVPGILANISKGVSLGSTGNEMQKAIEIMQSRVIQWQMALMEYYNNVLLPGMGISQKVEIINFNPISQPPTIDDKVWEFLDDSEKAQWVKKNFPDIQINRQFASSSLVPAAGAIEPPPAGNSALKDLKIADLNRIQKIVARFNLSQTDPDNSKALTFEQAKQILAGYGFTDEEINAWLVTADELND